jgi:hypothetical protein
MYQVVFLLSGFCDFLYRTLSIRGDKKALEEACRTPELILPAMIVSTVKYIGLALPLDTTIIFEVSDTTVTFIEIDTMLTPPTVPFVIRTIFGVLQVDQCCRANEGEQAPSSLYMSSYTPISSGTNGLELHSENNCLACGILRQKTSTGI